MEKQKTHRLENSLDSFQNCSGAAQINKRGEGKTNNKKYKEMDIDSERTKRKASEIQKYKCTERLKTCTELGDE